jgi:hypothetical protein
MTTSFVDEADLLFKMRELLHEAIDAGRTSKST